MALDTWTNDALTRPEPYELVWTGSWSGDGLASLAADAELQRFGIRQARLTQSGLAAVSAAVASDRQVDGLISRSGERAGVVIGMHWLSDDGTYAFLRQIATSDWSRTAVQDFAHMGGSSLFYYIGRSVGARGYSTCLIESSGWDQTNTVWQHIAMLGLLDVILTLRISHAAAKIHGPACTDVLRPRVDSVVAEVHRHPAAV